MRRSRSSCTATPSRSRRKYQPLSSVSPYRQAPTSLSPRSTSLRYTPAPGSLSTISSRSEEHTSELQSPCNLVCRLLLEKKKNTLCTTRIVRYHSFFLPSPFPTDVVRLAV